MPAAVSGTSAILMGNAEIDVAKSPLKMRESEDLLKSVAPLHLLRAMESGSEQRRETALAGLSGEQAMSVEILKRLAAAAAVHDQETGGHIARTGIYAGMIARGLGLPDYYAEMVAVAATVHDVGKIGIEGSILSKPAPLSSQEYEIMKTHTVIGEQILSGSSCPLLQMAASIAVSHHERWDGSGYPYGLVGEQIPLSSRIVMLADQYDALRSRRVYKRSLDHATTCAILSQGDAVTRPGHFDPRILKRFLELEPQFAEACRKQQKQDSTLSKPVGARAHALDPIFDVGHGKISSLTVSGHC